MVWDSAMYMAHHPCWHRPIFLSTDGLVERVEYISHIDSHTGSSNSGCS